MIFGIGVDVLEAKRITRTLERFGPRFTNHLLMPAELAQLTKTKRQIEAAAEIGAPVVELHTGAYAEREGSHQATELERLRVGARLAAGLGIEVHAGHGLNYHNVQPVAAIRDIVELNIGHSIIARALFDGLSVAVRDMKQLMAAVRA